MKGDLLITIELSREECEAVIVALNFARSKSAQDTFEFPLLFGWEQQGQPTPKMKALQKRRDALVNQVWMRCCEAIVLLDEKKCEGVDQ
jgi:hypothetical protein